MGKTRLGVEALALAASRGLATLRVAGTQAAFRLPFGAYGSLLPELTPGVDRIALLQQIARAIEDRGEGRPVALLVDDAHLLDEASAALTHQLVMGGRALLLATVRSGEPAFDAVRALWKDGLAERIEVRPFSAAEVEAVLAAALGGPVDPAAVRLLWQRTEGNALFLRELVLGALDAGALRDDGELWRLHGPLPATSRLVELVDERLAHLTPAERGILEVLALAEPLGIDLAHRLGDGADLEELERRGIVRVEQDGRRLQARLGHPLYGEVVRARLSPLRTRAASHVLADVVAGTGARRRDDVLRLASWRLEGAGWLDPTLMLAGAREAHARQDHVLAVRLGRAARDAGGGFEAGLFLGIATSHAGRPEEAEPTLAELAGEARDDAQRAALAASRVQNFLLLRRLDLAIECAEAGEASIVDIAARAELAALRAPLLGFSGRNREARELAVSHLPHATGQARVLLCIVGSYLLATAGRLTEALSVNAEGLAAHLALEGPPLLWPPAVQRFIRIDALSLAGRLADAEAQAGEWHAAALAEGSPLERAYATSGLAKTLLRQGRMRPAIRWAQLSASLFREEGRASEQGYALAYLAHARALTGAHEEAAAALAGYDALPTGGGGEFGPEVLWTRAWVSLAGGDADGAAKLLGEAAELARANDSFALEASACHDLARIGRAREVAARLAELADVVEGPLAAPRARHAAALVAGDAASLDAVSSAFEEAGAVLAAAEAAVDAAVRWRRGAEQRKAAASERRAGALAIRCEGARTPGLATAAPVRAVLTPRELEIARLAAAGLANKDIAARLSLSPRTVENKLHEAYGKLGVERRGELSEALKGY